MQNNYNTDETTEPNTTRRTRRRRRRIRVNREHQEPMLTIHTTILSFITLVFFLTPIIVGVYTTIYVFAALIYKILIYPILPNFLHCAHSENGISYFKTFLVTVLMGILIATWRTVYYGIRVFIILVEDGEI